MPQEISVSYQAIKSKVYRLIDSLVVGEKSEAEVQESIRRWWALDPSGRPADRSKIPLDGAGPLRLCPGLHGRCVSLRQQLRVSRPQLAESALPGKRMRLLERMVKESSGPHRRLVCNLAAHRDSIL